MTDYEAIRAAIFVVCGTFMATPAIGYLILARPFLGGAFTRKGRYDRDGAWEIGLAHSLVSLSFLLTGFRLVFNSIFGRVGWGDDVVAILTVVLGSLAAAAFYGVYAYRRLWEDDKP